jgi:hypothetical protein
MLPAREMAYALSVACLSVSASGPSSTSWSWCARICLSSYFRGRKGRQLGARHVGVTYSIGGQVDGAWSTCAVRPSGTPREGRWLRGARCSCFSDVRSAMRPSPGEPLSSPGHSILSSDRPFATR